MLLTKLNVRYNYNPYYANRDNSIQHTPWRFFTQKNNLIENSIFNLEKPCSIVLRGKRFYTHKKIFDFCNNSQKYSAS